MRCTKCGKTISKDEAQYCAYCGNTYCEGCGGGICECYSDLHYYS